VAGSVSELAVGSVVLHEMADQANAVAAAPILLRFEERLSEGRRGGVY
jgi:hypothetical protein